MSQQSWDRERRQHAEWLLEDLEGNMRSVPCQIDMDDLEPIPLTKERALGLQQELSERLGSRSFQQQLRSCERTYGKGSLDFRREHQQLVLGVQSTVLPKYGYEASLEGVAQMLKDFKAFSGDGEVAGNIEAIDSLIWKYETPSEQRRVASLPRLRPKARQRQLPEQQQQQQQQQPLALALPERPQIQQRREEQERQQRMEWEQFQQLDDSRRYQDRAVHDLADAGALQGHRPESGAETIEGPLAYRGLGVEIDMDDIHVPFTKEEAIALQKELLDRFSSQDFQAQLRECADRHGTQSMDFRREHQELVLKVQSEVLPMYGFEANLEGVARMKEAVDELSGDAEVASNTEDIHLLIWSCGGRPPQPRGRPRAPQPPAGEPEAELEWPLPGRPWREWGA